MKLEGRQVRIMTRFCGKGHSVQLTEPALVLQGEIRKLSFPLVDILFQRALAEWTTVTIPYSRLIKLQQTRWLWIWLAVFLICGVLGALGIVLLTSSAANTTWVLALGVFVLAFGIVGAPLGLMVLLFEGLKSRVKFTYRDAFGKKKRMEIWIRTKRLRQDFFTQLEANWRTAVGYVETTVATTVAANDGR